MIRYSILVLIFFLSSLLSIANKLDSLLTELNKKPDNVTRVLLLNLIFNEVLDENPKEAYGFAFQELKEAESLGDSVKIADANLHIGLSFDYQNQFDSALYYYYVSYQLYNTQREMEGVSRALLNIGIVNYLQGNYTGALKNYIDVVNIVQELGLNEQLSNVYNNMGIIYVAQKKYDKALNCYEKALQIDQKLENWQGLAQLYNNFGIVYRQINENDKALQSYFKALQFKLKVGEEVDAASTYGNIGMLYFYEKNYSKALEYMELAFDLEKQVGNERAMAGSMINLGEIHLKLNNVNKALQQLNEGVVLSEKYNNYEYLQYGYESLAEAYYLLGKHKQAFDYHKKYTSIKDSLLSFEQNHELSRLETQFQFDQKNKEIELLKKEQQISKLKLQTEEKEVEKRNVFIYSLLAGILLVLAIVGLLFNRYQVKKRANSTLLKQNDEINRQKREIELKNDMLEEINTEITDSINYARRIQQALFKSDEYIAPNVADYFILFKPKDIVSGDFYWAKKLGNYLYVVVADCTGHGVPGAFMSILGNAFLSEIFNNENELTPADVLNKLRSKIIYELGQSGKEHETKDGMDVSMIRIKLESETCITEVMWAGANNPLWVVSQKTEDQNKKVEEENLSLSNFDFELKELKPDKQPVGYYYEMNDFTNHEIELIKGDRLYLFTDGYADQFGGKKGKKLKHITFKNAIISSRNLSLKEQQQLLDSLIENWRGELEQIDDICVMGIEV